MSILHFFKTSSKRSRRGRRTQPTRARLCLETLENRITPSFALNNGHLIINGDDLSSSEFYLKRDVITIDVTAAGGMYARITSLSVGEREEQSFAPGAVTSIEINPGDGINGVAVQRTLSGVPMVINCTSTDGFDIPSGDLDAIQGPINVHGNGLTEGELDDRLNTRSNSYTVSNLSVSRGQFGGLVYTGLRSLRLFGAAGGNTFNVISTSLGTGYLLVGGLGLDTYNLGSGNLDGLAGTVAVGASGNLGDAVVLHDETNPLPHKYEFNGTGLGLLGEILRRDDFSFASVDGSPQVIFNGGSAANTYDMEGGGVPALTINGGAGNDTFNVSPTSRNLDNMPFLPMTLNGGAGVDSLSVDDRKAPTSESYEITSASVFRPGPGVRPITYSGMQIVDVSGSNHGNTFTITSADNVIVDAGLGNNLVTVGNPSNGLGDIFGVNVIGLDNTRLVLDDQFNAGATSYEVHSNQVIRTLGFGRAFVSYSGINDLVLNFGTGGNDIAILDKLATTSLTINAGSGGDNVHAGDSLAGDVGPIKGFLRVVGANNNTRFTVFDQSAATPQTYFVSDITVLRDSLFVLYQDLQSVTVNGGSGGNQFKILVPPAITPITLNGGAGSNSLSGPSLGTPVSWTINGPGSGKIGNKLAFTAMHDLVGGRDKDLFQFTATGSIAGTIDGGASDNELIYVPQASPVTINLQTKVAPQIHAGTAGGFSNILVFVGSGSPADTLIGPDADTVWTISSGNGGFLSGNAFRFTYTRFGNLVGGTGMDVYRFVNGGALAGRIDGGAAPLQQGNWLNYSELATGVSANLQTGAASGVAGGVPGRVANIQHAFGGDGANTLIGNAQGNILIGGPAGDSILGGAGRSVLIGDKGADNVTGGSGGDILIGDATTLDAVTTANEKALMAILAEWQSADSYDTRFQDINTGAGGGLNGTFKLNFGITVKDDGAADIVAAAPAAVPLDWFFQGAGDTLANVQAGEHINNNTPAAFKDRTVTSPIDEGGRATVSGTITDPDPRDSFTLVVNWGDGKPDKTYTFPPGSNGQRVSVSHRYRDNGTYSIQLSWHDPLGPANKGTLTVTVNNVAPSVDAGGDATLRKGEALERHGSFTDQGTDTWIGTVDYGDGAGPQSLKLKGRHFTLEHKYRNAGTYHVVVTVRDDDGGVGTASFDIVVR